MAKKKFTKQEEQELRPQPHSSDAEKAILGSILVNEEAFDVAAQYITSPETFYYDDHQLIWKVMCEMRKNHEPIDTVTVSSKFTGKESDRVSGYYLTGLYDSIPSAAKSEHYARIVAEKYLQRRLINVTYEVQKSAYENTKEFDKLLDDVRRYTEELQELQPHRRFNLQDSLRDTIDSIKKPDNMINYGFDMLDEMAGGMTRGEVTVIAGRPGHGKTTFTVNLIPRLVNQGLKVLIVSREMTEKELLKKLITLESGVLSYRMVRNGNLDESSHAELKRMYDFCYDRYKDNLFIYDDLKDLNSTISIIQKVKPDVIIDDYIQLVSVKGYSERRFELENVMKEYKWIAKSMGNVPILVSQLNREIERRIDPIPKLSDLAESGTIEQVAENVLFVYYDYKVNYDFSELGKYRAQIIAAKVRYGETCMMTVGYNGDKVRYYEKDREVFVHDKNLVDKVAQSQPKKGIRNAKPF